MDSNTISSNQLLSQRSVLILGLLDIIIVGSIISFFVYIKSPGVALLILFIACITIPIILYDVNCTYVGSCKIWGILKTISLAFQAIGTIIVIIIQLIGSSKTQNLPPQRFF